MVLVGFALFGFCHVSQQQGLIGTCELVEERSIYLTVFPPFSRHSTGAVCRPIRDRCSSPGL